MLKSTCATCGCKKCQILPGARTGGTRTGTTRAVKKPRMRKKKGEGIFGWIPGVGSTLDNVGNALLGAAPQIIASQAVKHLGAGIRRRR
jgi:hypothetical protein